MDPELRYDPTMNRATLATTGRGWYLWLEHPDEAPAEPHFSSRNEVGDAILDFRLSNLDAVTGYFEQCLKTVGYSTTREGEPGPEDWIAAWALAPGTN